MDKTRDVTILLVEDNPDHAEFALNGLKKANVTADVFWVKDGEEALDFLEHRGEWAEAAAAPRPGLILLDINLPKLNGHDVLRRIKDDLTLRSIPVVMLTTSDHPEDVTVSYRAGANSYVRKPVSFKQFIERIQSLNGYWTVTNVLPPS